MLHDLILAAGVIVNLLMPCDGKVCPYQSYAIYACVLEGKQLRNCQYMGAVKEETLCKTAREDTA